MANSLDDRHIEDIKEAFEVFDKDHKGVISVDAVPTLLRVIGQSLTNDEVSVLAEQESHLEHKRPLQRLIEISSLD